MKRKSNSLSVTDILYSTSLIAITIILIGINNAEADDGTPAFFLKIAKNIPRVGRSSEAEEFFRKSSKNVPTIDKREEMSFLENGYTLSPFGKDGRFFKATKRRIGYAPATGSDTWTWEHFPLAIEGPPELWRSLAGYSDEKAFESSDDIDNEIRSRDKRAEVYRRK